MIKRILSLLSVTALIFCLIMPSPALAASRDIKANPSSTEAQVDQQACSDAARETPSGSESGNTKVSGATTRVLKAESDRKG
ncbi:MAG: hypothetical protein ACK55E_03865 [Cyanobacteriota bacterium]|jgi:hypothetical protein